MGNFYNSFKTPIITILVLFLTLFVYTKLAGPISFSINSVNTTKTDMFTASGEGKATGVPDSASLSVGVTQTGVNVLDTKDKTNTAVNKIISALKTLGIAENDIKTTNYSINPNYSDNKEIVPMMYPIRGGGSTITGYTVTQNFEVKIKDTNKVNKAVDIVSNSGANLIGGINFTFSDEMLEKLQNQARKEAVAKAKKKAQSLASASGLNLGKIINVVENSSFPGPVMEALKADSSQNTNTNITPGENTITINVTIYYETY